MFLTGVCLKPTFFGLDFSLCLIPRHKIRNSKKTKVLCGTDLYISSEESISIKGLCWDKVGWWINKIDSEIEQRLYSFFI